MMDSLDFSQIKMVAMDMDGTALNNNHVLSTRTIAAVKAVYDKGIKVIFATGRMLDAVKKHLQEADMDGVVVAHNGALLVDLKNNFIYRDDRVSKEILNTVYTYAKDKEIILHYNLGDQVMVEKERPLSTRYACELGISLTQIDDLSNYLQLPTSILMLGRKKELEKALAYIENLKLAGMNNVFIPWFEEYWMLQFIPNGASKGKAVMELAKQLGMDKSQVMSFGDSYNDIEMITESGIGIAMGNACESLKEVADYITLSNDEDGVAVILEKMAEN